MCLDAMAVFWNGTTGAWFVHWPLVICDLMWDLRGLQKAGGSQRANYCDGFRKNQLEEKDFNVSFCFSSLMKWALTLEQTLELQSLDGSNLGSQRLGVFPLTAPLAVLTAGPEHHQAETASLCRSEVCRVATEMPLVWLPLKPSVWRQTFFFKSSNTSWSLVCHAQNPPVLSPLTQDTAPHLTHQILLFLQSNMTPLILFFCYLTSHP